MTILLCGLICFIFIMLPFVPAIREVMRPSDSKALKITNHILRDPRSSPEFLYWHFAHLLGAESIEALEILGRVNEVTLLNDSILAVPPGLIPTIPKTVARVLSSGSLELAPRTTYLSKVVSLRSIHTGAANAINEIHAKDKLTLGAGSKVMWWASGADIVLENDLDLPGKIQASRSIRVEGKAQFHHLEAASIQAGASSQAEASGSNGKTRPEDFVALSLSLPRHSFTEHCEIKAGEVVEGDLIVKGNLILHENSRVTGSVKCHQKITLKDGARIVGNVVGMDDIECQGNNWIGGTVLSKKSATFANGTYIGSANQRVTISANTIRIHGAFQSHGTIRAWTNGRFI